LLRYAGTGVDGFSLSEGIVGRRFGEIAKRWPVRVLPDDSRQIGGVS
jgi:hypothetical protein